MPKGKGGGGKKGGGGRHASHSRQHTTRTAKAAQAQRQLIPVFGSAGVQWVAGKTLP